MMPVDLVTVGRKDLKLSVNTGSIIDFANLPAVVGSFLTILPNSKINTSPTHRAGASVSRTMWGSKHHLRCMQNIGLFEIASCIMRLDACGYVLSVTRSQSVAPSEHPSSAPPNSPGYHLTFVPLVPNVVLLSSLLLHFQIKVCWWLAIFHSCPSSTHALEQIALKD